MPASGSVRRRLPSTQPVAWLAPVIVLVPRTDSVYGPVLTLPEVNLKPPCRLTAVASAIPFGFSSSSVSFADVV